MMKMEKMKKKAVRKKRKMNWLKIQKETTIMIMKIIMIKISAMSSLQSTHLKTCICAVQSTN